MKFWLRYVPKERLVMGLPAYSGDFEMAVHGEKKRHYSAPVPDVPEGTRVQRVWLPYEQVNSYIYEDPSGRMHVFYASDAASTCAHLETADRLGIASIAFWHFEAVTPEMWEAVRAWHARRTTDDGASWWLVFP
jgi:spore germination protein YaaH